MSRVQSEVWIVSPCEALIQNLASAVSLSGGEVGFSGTLTDCPSGPHGQPPDLIVVDAASPAADVIAVLDCIGSASQSVFIPIIAVTEDVAARRVEAFHAGAHECIARTFHGEELGARMVSLLRLKRLQDKVLRHEHSLERANTELARLALLKDEFIATLSHELRTPLTAICEFTALMLEGISGDVSDAQRECLEVTLANGKHLALMIDDLLHLSHVSRAELRLQPTVTDLAALAEAAGNELLSQATQRGVRLHMEAGPEPPLVMLDPMRIRQALTNLMANAIKFSPADSVVTVRTELNRRDGVAQVHVIDQGPGLAADQKKRIYDRFYQAAPGQSSKNGLGLGLHVCLEIVSLHQGRLDLLHNAVPGCHFVLELPLDGTLPQTLPQQLPGQMADKSN